MSLRVNLPPWGFKILVNWSEINDPKYPADGEEGVIEKGLKIHIATLSQPVSGAKITSRHARCPEYCNKPYLVE